MRQALFLDFDGVLHPNLAAPHERMCLMPLLAETLADADIDIVISSSWRFEWPLGKLRGLFPPALRPRVVATTGPAHIGRHARWHEIAAYRQTEGIAHWRALDDARFEFPNPCDELIACEGSRGLQAPQCEALRVWLKREA